MTTRTEKKIPTISNATSSIVDLVMAVKVKLGDIDDIAEILFMSVEDIGTITSRGDCSNFILELIKSKVSPDAIETRIRTYLEVTHWTAENMEVRRDLIDVRDIIVSANEAIEAEKRDPDGMYKGAAENGMLGIIHVFTQQRGGAFDMVAAQKDIVDAGIDFLSEEGAIMVRDNLIRTAESLGGTVISPEVHAQAEPSPKESVAAVYSITMASLKETINLDSSVDDIVEATAKITDLYTGTVNNAIQEIIANMSETRDDNDPEITGETVRDVRKEIDPLYVMFDAQYVKDLFVHFDAEKDLDEALEAECESLEIATGGDPLTALILAGVSSTRGETGKRVADAIVCELKKLKMAAAIKEEEEK